MGNNTISQKIDAYAQANLKALKQEEAKTGRKMTKFDIAQYMLQHGKLNKNEYANWMNTREGFDAQAMTQAQKTALKQGNVWGFAGYGGGQESYLDSLTSFSQKTPVEQFNEIHSRHVKLNETVAERKKKAAEIQKHIQEQRVKKQLLHPNEAIKEQKLMDEIRSLPEVKETYTELMNDIKFQEMDKKQKTEFLLKTTGQKFYEAKERGDKEAMKEYLKQGIGLTFAYMDDKAGITDIKEAAKEFYGLNAFVDTIDKFVDDGDASNLSFGEKTWETIKGAGDAVDGFIGTQGVAFMGTLAVAAEAAAAAGIGKAFALVTQAYFAFEGGTMVVDGTVDVANAQTKEEARVGGQELGTGTIMLGGAAKSVKQGYRNTKIKESDAFAREYVKTANDQALVDEYNARETVSLDIYKNELIKRGYKPNEHGYFETPKPTRPSTYRDELPTPDYSKTRENFPADAHQSLSKPGKATAYTTDGKPDGIVYQGKDGKMYVPNKWDPEHPYEVSTGADGKPASVIMIYDEAGGDFAVGDPTTIASTYKNPATGKLDPLYHAETGKANAMEIVKDQVPSAYKIVKPGTEIQTKEGPRVVQDGEIVVYDTDGDPYVMPKKNFLKRQEPLKGDAESEALYTKLKNGEAIPETEVASSGNATKPSAKTFKAKQAPTRPSTYRDELPTPDYSKTRENFPADAHQSLSKPGKATAYTTDGKPDGIVYQGKDGKMYVPNKWDPEHPYEVSTGADGKPASVIMIYDEAGGDFAVGDPTTIASTYKNPATGKLDPLYHAETGKANAMEIVKDQVPSAYKIVKPGTEIQTKEGPRVVQDGEIVVYDTDGDPYVMPKKNFLKRQEPLKGDAESEALYAKLKNGEAIPETEVATSGNATKPSAKTFTLKAAAEAQQKSKTEVKTDVKTQTKPSLSPDIRNNLIKNLKSVKYDKQVTIDTMDQYPEFVEELVNFKVDGKQFFSMQEINDIIYNCLSGHEGILKASPERIRKVLNNPSEISFMRNESKNKVAGLWVALFR